MFQIIFEMRRKKSDDLTKEYFTVVIDKLYEKQVKDINKMNKAIEELNKAFDKSFLKNTNILYINIIKDLISNAKQKENDYQIKNEKRQNDKDVNIE